MANKGWFCLDGYLKRVAKLSDQEVGRLFRALMNYHATGEEPELTGRESVAFDFIREDIDAANEAYEAKCQQNRRNRLSTIDNGRQRSSTKADRAEEKATNAPKENTNTNENINEVYLRIKDVGQSAGASPAPAVPPVISIPLNDGTEYGVSVELVQEMEKLYPAVDIMQELRNMRGWSLSNPTKRKTKSGIKRFINTWLAREQDKPKMAAMKAPTKTVLAQQYQQRDYSNRDKELMDLFIMQNGGEPDQ